MSAATHTPGPWKTYEGRTGITVDFTQAPVEQHPSGRYIAFIPFGRSGAKRGAAVRYYRKDVDIANAALLSASPDLLAAAEDLLAKLEFLNGCNEYDMDGPDQLPEFAAIRAAIAKAKGIAA